MPQKMLSLLWPGTAEGGGQWGGGSQKGGGVWPSLSRVWPPRIPLLRSSPVLSPLGSPVLSPLSSLLFSLHSALPLSPSQEDLARPDLGG